MTWREWPLLLLYLVLAWEHQFLAFYLHEKIARVRQHDHIGNLDFFTVEEGVMANHGNELQADEKSLANHH
jgi:hypothetical protein